MFESTRTHAKRSVRIRSLVKLLRLLRGVLLTLLLKVDARLLDFSLHSLNASKLFFDALRLARTHLVLDDRILAGQNFNASSRFLDGSLGALGNAVNLELVGDRKIVGTNEFDDGLRAGDKSYALENFRSNLGARFNFTDDVLERDAFNDVGKTLVVESTLRDTSRQRKLTAFEERRNRRTGARALTVHTATSRLAVARTRTATNAIDAGVLKDALINRINIHQSFTPRRVSICSLERRLLSAMTVALTRFVELALP